MMFSAKSANALPLQGLCDILNAGFIDYILPIVLTADHLLGLMRNDAIDLGSSKILYVDGKESGLALVARRGRHCRLAAMSIIPEARGKGAGKWLMNEFLTDARGRGEAAMFLEVIEQNPVALALYERTGFSKLGRLVGFQGTSLTGEPGDLEEADIKDVVLELLAFGAEELPWQCSAEALAQSALPSRAFRLGPAWCIVSDPSTATIQIRTIVVEPDSRREGAARKLLLALFDRFPDKTWKVPIIFPQAVAPGLFESVGMTVEAISQVQMKFDLI
jgi:GNAT superfamily N-acetyltransferase